MNNRDDRGSGTDFASFSPTRHEVFTDYNANYHRWEGHLGLAYRFSRYDDPHVQGKQTKRRKDHWIRAEFQVSRELDWRRLAGFVRLGQTWNESNLDGGSFADNDYKNTEIMVGVEGLFAVP